MPGDTRKKRKSLQVRQDRVRIAQMYIQGKYQSEIGRELGLSQQQISYDIKAIQREWLKTTAMALDVYKAQELAKIDHLERTYWIEWEASRQETKTKTIKSKGDTEHSDKTLKAEERHGDPRYLQGVQWCIEQRCKLLELYQLKMDISGGLKIGALVVPADMTPDEWEKQFSGNNDTSANTETME